MSNEVSISDQEMKYTLTENGESIYVTEIESGDVCQVDFKEFSPFEREVYNFLIKQQEKSNGTH